MAYPFMKAMRYRHFLLLLESLDIRIRKSALSLVDPEGNLIHLTYLERAVDGIEYYFPLTFASETDEVQVSVMRSVCSALKLEPALVGLPLG